MFLIFCYLGFKVTEDIWRSVYCVSKQLMQILCLKIVLISSHQISNIRHLHKIVVWVRVNYGHYFDKVFGHLQRRPHEQIKFFLSLWVFKVESFLPFRFMNVFSEFRLILVLCKKRNQFIFNAFIQNVRVTF